jgi:LytR_cpsA_psr family/LytR cell envelope-related transcriptional attenuator
VDVCLNHAVYDEFSGADFPAGNQKLNAEQALAFVRQRHDLDNGDLDRTRRQQAFLVSVMRKLQDAGTFTDLGKLDGLIAVARKDIVLSSGWNEELFHRIGNINGENAEYQTLPVQSYDEVDGEAVNTVDPAAIRAQVAAAFNGEPSITKSSGSAPSSVVDVVNAGDTEGLANTISQTLHQRGYTPGEVRNPFTGEPRDTEIDYGSGASADAQHLATLLGISVPPRLDNNQEPGHIRVTLGADYRLPPGFGSSDATTSVGETHADSNRTGASSDPTPAPDRGQPIDGGGIPCVD